MIIMQTGDAVARKSYIEAKKLAKVIYSHEHDDACCIQYHPKGIKGRASSIAAKLECRPRTSLTLSARRRDS